MLSVIIIDNQGNEDNIRASVEMLREIGLTAISVVSPSENLHLPRGIRQVSTSLHDMGAMLSSAVSQSDGSRLIFVDARIPNDSENFRSIVREFEQENAAPVMYSPVGSKGQELEIPQITLEDMISIVSSGNLIAPLCLSVERSVFENSEIFDAKSCAEFMARVLITASMNELLVSRTEHIIEASQSQISKLATALNRAERSAILSQIINNTNIEDLFPTHDWKRHSAESAAAAYHSIAAQFMRLGDIQAANNALALGDKFEDSPRSLALRAVIAREKGEILGAVANLVSSLQQYEARKKNDGTHYLTFKPENLEIINTNLNAGLEALNKRDNQGALNFFAEAVFNFDPFYKEQGISLVRNTIQ